MSGTRLAERLDRCAVERVRVLGELRQLESGEFLVHDGAAPSHVFFVEHGLLKVLKSSVGGDVSFIGLRRPGTFVGELAVLTGAARSSSVQAVERSTVCAVRAREFSDLIIELPELSHHLLRATASELRDTTLQLHGLMTADATTRVADRLVHLAGEATEVAGQPTTIRLPVSQEELGEWAGVSRAAAVNALRELRNHGVIRTSRMKIEVLQLDLLRDRAAI